METEEKLYRAVLVGMRLESAGIEELPVLARALTNILCAFASHLHELPPCRPDAALKAAAHLHACASKEPAEGCPCQTATSAVLNRE